MYSGNDWLFSWPLAEAFSLRVGEICSEIPLRGGWEPDDRIALALASFRLAQEHHSSIHLLFSNSKGASANSLARPLLEAALRTTWIAEDASAKQIAKLIKNRDRLPLLRELNHSFLKRAEKPLNGSAQELLHSFTHGGMRALGAQFLEGPELYRANAIMVTLAGFALGSAGFTAARLLDRRDLLEVLTQVVSEDFSK